MLLLEFPTTLMKIKKILFNSYILLSPHMDDPQQINKQKNQQLTLQSTKVNDHSSNFQELLQRDNSTTIHKNIQALATYYDV